MRPEDLALIRRPCAIAVSPRATHVAIAVQRAVDRFGAHLYDLAVHDLVDNATVFVRQDCGSANPLPAWEPGGERLAYLDRAGSVTRVFVTDVVTDGTSEASKVCDVDGIVTHLAWAGPGKLVLAVLEPEEDSGHLEMRRATTAFHRSDGIGRREGRGAGIYLASTEPGVSLRRLTSGPYLDAEPVWLAGHDRLAFTSDRAARDAGSLARDLYTIGLDGGLPRRITDTGLLVTSPQASVDGQVVLFLGVPVRPGNDIFTGSAALYVADPTSSTVRASPRGPTGDVDITAFAQTPEVLVAARHHRGSVIATIHPAPDRQEPDRRAEEPLELSGRGALVSQVSAAGDTICYAIESPHSAGEVWSWNRRDGPRRLTDLGAAFHAGSVTFDVTAFTVDTADGHQIDGWVAVPGGGGPHPGVLMVHGGPHYAYGWAFLDQVHVLAAAGYAVIFGNPRGSAGYGDEAARSIVGRFGTADVDDVRAILAGGIERGNVDAGRLAVIGASYGGFMSAWLAARTNLFRTAIIDRPVVDWESMRWTSDLGVPFTDTYMPAGPEQRRLCSPATYADQIEVPCLLLTTDQDLRCPPEQAQQLLARLQDHGVETELWTVIGESHMLHVDGRPASRIRRFEVILDWLARRLPAGRTEAHEEALR